MGDELFEMILNSPGATRLLLGLVLLQTGLDNAPLPFASGALELAHIRQGASLFQQDWANRVAKTGDAELLFDPAHPLGQPRQLVAELGPAGADLVALLNQIFQPAADGGVFRRCVLHHNRFSHCRLRRLSSLLHHRCCFIAAAGAEQALQLLHLGLSLRKFLGSSGALGIEQRQAGVIAQPLLLQHGDLLIQCLSLGIQHHEPRISQQWRCGGRNSGLQLGIQLSELLFQIA